MKVFYKQVQLNPTTETDYTDLVSKPLVNGVELDGDLSTEQIKVTWYGTQAEFDALGTYSPTTFYIIDDGVPVGEQPDYLDLANKPSINGQILTGNKLSSDIGMYTKEEVDNMMASLRSIKVAAALPVAPVANTMYYIGPDSEGVYMVYLYDATLQRIDLGPSVQKLYDAGKAIQIDVATNVIDVKFDDKTLKTNANNALYVNKDNVSIKEDANGQLYVPTTKSGDRWGVYPYTDTNGNTPVGKFINFYNSDDTTSSTGSALWSLNADGEATYTGVTTKKGDLWLNAGGGRGGLVLTAGNINHNTIKGTDTGAPVDEAAIQHFTRTLTIAGATIIPNNSDLNTAQFTKPGRYAITNNAGAATLVNSPTTAAFIMEVENNLSSVEDAQGSGYSTRARRLRAHDGSSEFVQSLGCDGSGVITYGPWKRVMIGSTTASGDRFDVYPYTTSDGLTHNGKLIRLYQTDGATGRAADIGLVGTNTNVTVENTLNSAQTGTILTSGLVPRKVVPFSFGGSSYISSNIYDYYRTDGTASYYTYAMRSYYSKVGCCGINNWTNFRRVVHKFSLYNADESTTTISSLSAGTTVYFGRVKSGCKYTVRFHGGFDSSGAVLSPAYYSGTLSSDQGNIRVVPSAMGNTKYMDVTIDWNTPISSTSPLCTGEVTIVHRDNPGYAKFTITCESDGTGEPLFWFTSTDTGAAKQSWDCYYNV